MSKGAIFLSGLSIIVLANIAESSSSQEGDDPKKITLTPTSVTNPTSEPLKEEPGFLSRFIARSVNIASKWTSEEQRYRECSCPDLSYEMLVEELFGKVLFKDSKKEDLEKLALKDYPFDKFSPYIYQYADENNSYEKSFIITGFSYGQVEITINNPTILKQIREINGCQEEGVFNKYLSALRNSKTKADMVDYSTVYNEIKETYINPYKFLTDLKDLIPIENRKTRLPRDLKFCEHAYTGYHTHTKIVLRLLGFDKKNNVTKHFSVTGYRVPDKVSQSDVPYLISLFRKAEGSKIEGEK